MMIVSSAAMYAQQVEPNFDVSLRLVIGSNDPAVRAEMPAELSNVAKQIKSNFGFSSYRLAGTFIGRVANTGNFDYKSTSNIFGQEVPGQTQSFLEWSVSNLKTLPTAKGGNGFQAQAFRFGVRVPVLMNTAKDDSGKVAPYYNYESIGLGLSKVGLSDNTPTLIGTLNLPGTNGTIFLIMTVRSAD
jgi:hypothetical protein